MSFYQSYTQAMHQALAGLAVTDHAGQPVPPDAAFDRWRDWTREVKTNHRTCFLIGNGASAMMASHMAIDGTKNAGVNSLALNDPAYLTAISNDLSYEEVFSFPLQRLACLGDLLVTISSSGNSPNVLRAIRCARDLGLRVITLSAMKPDNASRKAGDLNFYIPGDTYGIAESSHAVLLHCWLDHFIAGES
jgi:D-sedoheptulose 7-phosphate isomerase